MRAVLGSVCFAALAFAQSPSFEAAAIKQAAAENRATVMKSDPGRLVYANVTLRNCLAVAYGLKEYEVAGPSYIDTGHFDIVATTAAATPEDLDDADAAISAGRPVSRPVPPGDTRTACLCRGNRQRKTQASGEHGGETRDALRRRGICIRGRHPDRVRGGILPPPCRPPRFRSNGTHGRYDIRLEFESEPGAVKKSMMDGSFSSSLIAAVQSQLGLKMESTKAPVEMLIVDSAEKAPSEN